MTDVALVSTSLMVWRNCMTNLLVVHKNQVALLLHILLHKLIQELCKCSLDLQLHLQERISVK